MEGAVVLDCGSGSIKAGRASSFPSDNEPYVVTPAAVRRMSGGTASTSGSSGEGVISYPVQRGQVVDWPALESILHDVLYEQLGWQPGDEGNLLLGESLGTSRLDRELMTHLMFEQFNVSGLFVSDQAVLSLYALGKLTGCVIDLGHGKSDISTVSEGALHVAGARQLPYGGWDVDHLLRRLLAERGVEGLDDEAIHRLKCSGARLAPEAPGDQVAVAQHTLPDGQVITLKAAEAEACGEAALQPRLLDPAFEGAGVFESAVISALAHQEPALRKAVLENVVICGGGSAIPGLAQRCLRDMRALLPPTSQPVVVPRPEYMPPATMCRSVWMGGAVLAKVVFQQNHQVTKWDYEESGPACIHRKCMS